ncbi:hydrolase [Fistulina hepatica ATCC 64428]|uniref:Hydrolase n=1 Tax=Fistulina hepatica ATCC 64428 TaxID=1128425 RepID=A0A0D7A7C1_9AGAR|nr:hydrolase [Fistulina hepatica ATCC 64428]
MVEALKQPLRIAVVQFSPKIGHVDANIARARILCQKIEPHSVDVLCFPEMIFTGYVFENASQISPYLEAPKTGPTSRFCSEVAKRLRCYVFAGYPEKLERSEKTNDENIIGANSACIIGPGGEWVGGYRKTNLFETDKTWVKPGTGFASFVLPDPLRRVSLGICMDLNAQPPHDWTLKDGPYELADHCLEYDSDILILLNAWLHSAEQSPEEDHTSDWRTLNFWAARLRPLWGNMRDDLYEAELDPGSSAGDGNAKQDKETVVVVCNRCGEENGKRFAGSSALFSMRCGSGRPHLLDFMDDDEEGVRIWQLSV